MAVPQLPQNFDPGAITDWHLGHVAATGIGPPQCRQNLLPSGFCWLHFGQAIIVGKGAAGAAPLAEPAAVPPAALPSAPAIICGSIMPMPAPRPRLAAPPPAP